MYFIRWLITSHFAKEKPVFPVLIPIKQRLALCFHALYDGMVRWMKPRSTSLLSGTIADFAKGKPELLSKTRCYGSNSLSYVCRSNDRAVGRPIGSSCCALREDDSDVEADALHCAAGDLASVASGTFPLLLEAQVNG